MDLGHRVATVRISAVGFKVWAPRFALRMLRFRILAEGILLPQVVAVGVHGTRSQAPALAPWVPAPSAPTRDLSLGLWALARLVFGPPERARVLADVRGTGIAVSVVFDSVFCSSVVDGVRFCSCLRGLIFFRMF